MRGLNDPECLTVLFFQISSFATCECPDASLSLPGGTGKTKTISSLILACVANGHLTPFRGSVACLPELLQSFPGSYWTCLVWTGSRFTIMTKGIGMVAFPIRTISTRTNGASKILRPTGSHLRPYQCRSN